MQKRKKIILWSLISVVVLFSIYFLPILNTEKETQNVIPEVNSGYKPENTQELNITPVQKENNSLKLIIGEYSESISFNKGDTLERILLDKQKTGELKVIGKEYTGLGFFVTEIGGLKQGEGKNLFYYINDKEASVGVSSYNPQNGDIVEWKLK